PAGLTREDESNLKLLSVLFYCYAGICGLAALLTIGVLVALLVFAAELPGARGTPGFIEFESLFGVIFGTVLVLFTVKTVVMILGGRTLANRRGHGLAMVGAVLALTNMPLGTALGIFALITLSKPQVKGAFGAA